MATGWGRLTWGQSDWGDTNVYCLPKAGVSKASVGRDSF